MWPHPRCFYSLLFLLASPYPSAAVVDSSAPTLELDPRLLLALDSAACSQSVAEWLDSVSILQAESPQRDRSIEKIDVSFCIDIPNSLSAGFPMMPGWLLPMSVELLKRPM